MYRHAFLVWFLMAGTALGQEPPAESLVRQLEEARQQLLRHQTEAGRLRQILDTTTYQHRLEIARREWLDGNVARAQVLLDECPEPQRGFEWRLLDRCVRGARVTGCGVGEVGLGLGFRAGDEEVLLVGSALFSWDVGPGQDQVVAVPARRAAVPMASVRRAAPSLDGNLVAVADDGPEVQVIDLRTGQVVRKLGMPAYPVNDLAFSRDGRRLAVLAQNTVVVWDVIDGQDVFGVTATTAGAVSLDLSPTGDRLALGHDDGGVRIWDLDAGQVVRCLDHRAVPTRLRFHPEGNRLAVLAGDRLALWPLNSAEETSQEPASNPAGVVSFAWSPDGTRLAAATGVVVQVWNGAGTELLETHRGHTDRVRHIAFSTSGRHLASLGDDGLLKVWDVPGHRVVGLVRGHAAAVSALAWSPDGRNLATASLDRTVKVWDVATRHVLRTLGTHPGSVNSVAYSPDGKWLASGCDDGIVRIWDAATGRPTESLAGFKTRVTAVAYSLDGKYLAAIAQDGLLQVQTRADGKTRGVRLPGAGLFGLAFAPDGSQLAVACSDLSNVAIRLFDPTTLREQELLKGPRAQPVIAWHPDGSALAFASSTGTRIFSRKPGGEERFLHDVAGTIDLATAVTFSPDGQRLATTGVGRPVRIWDTATGLELLATQEGNSGAALAFSPDGTQLALGESTGLVRLFEAPARPTPRTYLDSSYHLAFSPDGRWMLTGLRRPEHLLQLWDVRNQRKGPVLDTVGGGLLSHLVYFSPDSATVRTLQEQREGGRSKFLVRFWDVVTGRETGRSVIEPPALPSHWHWNGTQLAVAIQAPTAKSFAVHLWDARTGNLLRTLDDVGPRATSLVLAPDGSRLLVAALAPAEGRTLSRTTLWDLTSGKPMGEPLEQGLRGERVLGRVVFRPDGKVLAGIATDGQGDGTLVLWDAATLKAIESRAVPRVAGSLVFAPDGKHLLLPCGSLVHIVGLEGEPDREQVVAPYLPFHVDQVAFAPDGRRFAVQGSLYQSSRVYLWDFPLPSAPDRTAARRLDPVLAGLHHRSEARCALREAAWFAAVFHLDRLLLQHPEASDLYRQRGRALVGLQQHGSAVPDLARAIQGNVTGIGNDLRRSDWQALQPYVESALVKTPDNWPVLALRGHVLAGQGLWPQAVQAFARAVKQGGQQVTVLDRYAFAALGAEDPLLYKRVCGQLLDAFPEPKDATTANNIAWACLLGREGVKPDRPLALARRAVEAATYAPAETRHAYLNTLALALYRSDQVAEATRMVQAAIEVKGSPSRLDHLLLALIEGREQRKEAARGHLALARQGREDDSLLLGSWETRLELAQFEAEVEALLRE